MIWSWYTSRWWVGCYIWYNVTAHPVYQSPYCWDACSISHMLNSLLLIAFIHRLILGPHSVHGWRKHSHNKNSIKTDQKWPLIKWLHLAFYETKLIKFWVNSISFSNDFQWYVKHMISISMHHICQHKTEFKHLRTYISEKGILSEFRDILVENI